MLFKDLGLSENILKAIDEVGYTTPTPIQAQAIPLILMGRDLVGLAQTGTGKTAGFTLPMIEVLAGGRARARMPRSLVLTPTRELAAQVAENFDLYGKHSKLTKVLLVGGESMEEQIKLLDRGVDVLIATPGRLLDLFERGKILLSDIKILVIDEADRMMDMGFIPDIEKIVGRLPVIRQTLLFSATMPPEIKKLTQKFLSNPKEVSVAPPASTAERVEQFMVRVHPKEKREALERLIKQENVQNAFIFCNRKRDVDDLFRWMERRRHPVKALHGDMPQKNRTQTLQDFKDGKVTLLVCSDVAARGLDIDGMSHVFNYDVPMHPDDYVHRIGRTGRAGMSGRAWTLVTREDEKFLDAILKLIKKDIPEHKLSGGRPERSEESADREPRREGRHEGGRGGRHDRGRDQGRRPERSDRPQGDRPERERPQRPVRQESPEQRDAEERRPQRNAPASDKQEAGEGKSIKGFGDDLPGFFGKS